MPKQSRTESYGSERSERTPGRSGARRARSTREARELTCGVRARRGLGGTSDAVDAPRARLLQSAVDDGIRLLNSPCQSPNTDL